MKTTKVPTESQMKKDEEISAEEQAVRTKRTLLSFHGIRMVGAARDVKHRGSRLFTNEEGGKRAKKLFDKAVDLLIQETRTFGEYLDNRSRIVSAADGVKNRLDELVALGSDTNLDWVAGLITEACDTLRKIAAEEIPVREPDSVEMPAAAPGRWDLLTRIDEYYALLDCLGDPRHGGVDEVDALKKRVRAVRSEIAQKVTAPLPNPKRLVTLLEEIRDDVAALANLPSTITRDPFDGMRLAQPTLLQRITAIIDLVDGNPRPPQRSLIPVVNSRQIRSLIPTAEWGFGV